MDKKQVITSFSELTSSELKHISGGDWWSNFFNRILHNNLKITEGVNKQLLG